MSTVDVLSRLIWEEINTMDPRLADLCDAARREIERLREYIAALQEDRQMAGNKAAAMRAAGDQLHAWMTINATSSQQDREDFEVVLNAWEEARRRG